MAVEIVLATYNGASHLPALLDSLLAQDYQHWQLIIRDDNSTDGTAALLAHYAEQHPDRIRILSGEKKRLGITGNFSALLAATTAPYVLCCDQDDVWQPNKISLTLTGMQELESAHGSTVPLLVHTDSTIVNESLEITAPSFAAFHQLNPSHNPLSRLLIQNTVQGCTLMVNRALLALALPLPPVIRMYDMWLAQIAAGMGHIGYIDRPTVLYRQHAKNAVGARRKPMRERVAHIQHMMESNVTQAILYLDRFSSALPEKQRQLVTVFAKMPDKGFLQRRLILIRNEILREPTWQNVPMLLFV